ncbi:MAG: hypothetical protein HDKAJFGB_02687 [Anaerolineae bacterium]|nr:hypothetical protein [Anaerolineae bacterium]
MTRGNVERDAFGRFVHHAFRKNRGGLCPRNQFAEPKQNVLITRETIHARLFQNHRERAHCQCRIPRAVFRFAFVQNFEPFRPIVVIRAFGFQMLLPAVTRNRPLHNFVRAFVNARDTHIAFYFFDHVFFDIAVTAERLNRVFRRLIARFRRRIFRHRAFGLQTFFAVVQTFRHPFNVRTRGFQTRRVRHNQFVRVPLFLVERRAALHACLRITNRAP